MRQPNQVTLDASIVGGAVGYAANVAQDRWVGVQLGVGGDWLNRTVAGGPHFTDNGGDLLIEVGNIAFFYRQRFGAHFTLDAGVRAGPALHGNDLDDDLAGAGFAGVYAMPMFTWQRLSVGPRIMAGTMTEFSPESTEFGVNVALLTARVTF